MRGGSSQASTVKVTKAKLVDANMMRTTRPLSAPQRSAGSDTLLALGSAAARAQPSPADQSLNNLAACRPRPVATEAKRSPSTRVAAG
jgi:hypothetical protein